MIRFAETRAEGEPLQTGGEQENRISESTGGVARGGCRKTGRGQTCAELQASGIGASVNRRLLADRLNAGLQRKAPLV